MSGIITIVSSLPQYIATATVPDLTTIFTPSASCNERWIAADTPSIAWSTYSRDGYSPPVDPIYYSCLPRNLKGPHYSPGVCTEGQTIAGITKYEAGSRTMWQAQCCKSGLTISVQTIQSSAVSMCVSAISTPLPVHALITTTYVNDVQSSYYDYVVNDRSTISNMTTMTRGTAVADPLYVAWESSDLSLFPVAYATSLAQKIGVAFTPTATPSSGASSRGPPQTGTAGGHSQTESSPASDSGGLSSGAKIGIGVGVGVGASFLLAFIAMGLVIRRLRRRNQAVTTYPNESTPAMDGQGVGPVKQKWYQRARPNQEAEVNNGVNELDSFPVQYVPHPPVELEGSHTPGPRY